jgi:NADPH:quinone reductase-like Zn-dependent oxidoreductase
MKAVVVDHYGPPEVLQFREVAQPQVGRNQVLIRVRAAGVNPIDWRIRNGSLRFILPGRLPLVLGFDVSGEVAEVGSEVTALKVGDEVFAFLDARHGGGYAECAVASQQVVVPKPENLSHEEAAAIPLAASTALQALRDVASVSEGSDVLVNGASGGVGTFAVQIAKDLEAQVTGVCSSRNLDFVKELGADKVIDYTAEDFTGGDHRFDVVFDAVAKSSFSASRRALRPYGVYVTTVPSLKTFLLSVVTRLVGGRRCRNVLVRPRGDDLRHLHCLVERGKLRPEIQQVYPLEQAAEAHKASEAGHVRGKVVLKVS